MKSTILSLLFVLACGPLAITGCGGDSGTSGHGGSGGSGGSSSSGGSGGDGGSSGSTDTGGGTTGVIPHGPDPKFVAACEALCSTWSQVGCASAPTYADCQSNCVDNATVLDGLCTPEAVKYLKCSLDVDYVCTADGHVTSADGMIWCETELIAFNQCQLHFTCGQYCRTATEVGCGAATQEACVAVCSAEQKATGHCEDAFEQLRYCQTQSLACQDGHPTSQDCDADRGALVTCLQGPPIEDACALRCWESGGECDTGDMQACLTNCEAAVTPGIPDSFTCESELLALDYCESGGLACQNGQPVFETVACDAEKQAYDACVAAN